MQPCLQHFVAGCATFGTFGASLVVMNEHERRSGALWSVVPDDCAILFEREHMPMLRLATLLVGSAEVGEDIVQDAFASVVERWGSLDNPGGYLRTCVVNGSRMVLRRRGVEQRVAQERSPLAVEQPMALLELRDALGRLGERQRAVVVLRYFADLPDVEIAEVLDCRPSTVRSLVRRALRVLRKELE